MSDNSQLSNYNFHLEPRCPMYSGMFTLFQIAIALSNLCVIPNTILLA